MRFWSFAYAHTIDSWRKLIVKYIQAPNTKIVLFNQPKLDFAYFNYRIRIYLIRTIRTV